MSGGANKSFLSNPISFLRNNVLTIDVQSMVTTPSQNGGLANYSAKHNQGGLVTVNIAKDPVNKGLKSTGSAAVAYKVSEASGAPSKYSHQFSAYYLPFMNNDFRVMNLGNAADFFFTDTMNGCSFACGAGNPPKIGHFNRVSGPNDMIDQNAIDGDISGQFPGGVLKSLKKTDYKNDVGEAASLVGVRTNGTWAFYYQVYSVAGVTKTGKVYQIADGMPATVR
ncbi:hypothetical protein M0G74_01000 [Microbulbifer sp. CAU 1566]|uniref:hypothetical protein n=1 Tax=Microbulbifer sp. CAU 1566 TaxID=2933269 RepID=UPI002006985D|nr:hypothetical protein [Microbulbifer sp. CAU 1566]MCK7595842.1 hypothetical protein [Microbulbifer sp. CAU 1566]